VVADSSASVQAAAGFGRSTGLSREAEVGQACGQPIGANYATVGQSDDESSEKRKATPNPEDSIRKQRRLEFTNDSVPGRFYPANDPTRPTLSSPESSQECIPGEQPVTPRFPYYSQQVFCRIPVILPYDSPIFVCVQNGDIDYMRTLLTSGVTSIDAVDPYGLGLLYVSSLDGMTYIYLTFNISTQLIIVGEAADPPRPSEHAKLYLRWESTRIGVTKLESWFKWMFSKSRN
jgi:hypothetical protein